MKLLKNLTVIFILIAAASAVSGADDVKLSIDFDKSTVDPGEDAILEVTIENEESDEDGIDVSINIFAEEYDEDGEEVELVDETEHLDKDEGKTFNYTLNDLSSSKWDAYRCGSFKIRVEVEDEEKTETLRISGDEFDIEISPSEPSVDDEIRIKIEDDGGDEIKDEYITITNLDTEDSIKERTDDEGIFEFTPSEESEFDDSPAGDYEVTVDNKNGDIAQGHCTTKKTFNVKYKVDKSGIGVINPAPPSLPQVDEQVTLKITTKGDEPARYIDVSISGPSFNQDHNTDSNGFIYFTPRSAGDYDIKITDEDYFPVTRTISVAAKSQLSISFSEPEVGKEITITVKAEGATISSAEVTVVDPDNKKKTLTTASAGTVSFDVRISGKYKITARKIGYSDSSKEFEVYESFKITVPETADAGETIKLEVFDEDNNPVIDAVVKGENFNLNEKTDSKGAAEFIIDAPGEFVISIQKEGFTKIERTINAEGKLTIKLDPEKPILNKEVVISVLSGDTQVTSNILITMPDGTAYEAENESYEVTASQTGRYTVSASKPGYSNISVDFEVMHNVINLNYSVDGKSIVFNVTSDGKPVPDAMVGIYVTTNREGIAVLEFDENYDVVVMKESYDTKKERIEVPAGGDFLKILMAFIIFVLVIIIILLLLRGGKKDKKITKRDKRRISG